MLGWLYLYSFSYYLSVTYVYSTLVLGHCISVQFCSLVDSDDGFQETGDEVVIRLDGDSSLQCMLEFCPSEVSILLKIVKFLL